MNFKISGPYLILMILVASLCPQNGTAQEVKDIRIGIFSFEPINYIDNTGRPNGLYPALISEISRLKNWKVRYIDGSWSEGLERLENEEIDLMISIAWSNERAITMDYNQEAVLDLWGQVFIVPSSPIQKITDLESRTIAVMSRDFTGNNLKKTIQTLGIKAHYKEYPDFKSAMKAVEQGEADAAAIPQYYGLRHLPEYNLMASSILFSPYSIYFATKKGMNKTLLSDIDSCLIEWKNDKESIYYDLIQKWMTPDTMKQEIIPLWVRILLVITLAFIILIVYMNIILRKILLKRTNVMMEKESHYSSLVHQLNSVIMRLSPEGSVELINEYSLNLLNLKSEDVIGKSVLNLNLLPDELSLENIRNPENLKKENLIKKIYQEDTTIIIQWSMNVIRNADESCQEILCLGLNITQDIELQHALKESEERFISFMKNIPAYAFIKNERGEHVYSNPATLELLNVHNETYRTDDFHQDEESQTKIKDVEGRLLRGESEFESFEVETYLGQTNKQVRLQEIRFPILLSTGKKLLGGLAFDITESRIIEDQLNQSRKMQAIGELAGGIAHDFNNQLSGIMGYADLLSQGLDDPRLERYAAKLQRGVERASEVTQQLLRFSRKGSKESRTLNVNDLIEDLIALLSHSIEKKVKLHFDQQCESSVIQGDPNLIQNALLNISLNARDAMQGEGDLYFSTQRIYADDKMVALQGYTIKTGTYLVISIEDTGQGMNKEVQEKIFEPFYTTKEEGKGTGMGLAMVYGTMQDHQGNITVQSTPEKGTVFKLYFPCDQDEVQETQEIAEPSASKEGNYNIAIVDDEAMIREFLSLSLLEAGHRVALFEGGRQAVKAFHENPNTFDLVVLDMMMPGMSGLETYRELIKIQPEIPVLLSSGYSPKNEIQEIMKNPEVVYLQKPYSIKDLYKAIASLMSQNP